MKYKLKFEDGILDLEQKTIIKEVMRELSNTFSHMIKDRKFGYIQISDYLIRYEEIESKGDIIVSIYEHRTSYTMKRR